jgi:DNA repair exonuclease SbcCD ATPase subunit
MALWSSRTKAWNNPTRAVTNGEAKKIEITKEELDEVDEELEVEDLQKEIARKDWQIELLSKRVQELESQMMQYMKRVDSNTAFLQNTISELIQIKNAPPPVMAPARTAMEERLARLAEKKNSELSVSEAQKAKLPG